jgi:hypothetical protein
MVFKTLTTKEVLTLMMYNSNRLYEFPEEIETRWASPENPRGKRGTGGKMCHGRKGFASIFLQAGKRFVLAEEKNTSGVIRRIWMTVSDFTPKMLRSIRLDFYWDGCSKPAVSVPLGDFFGIGLGRTVSFQSALFSSPEGRSFNCTIPMPFKNGMKIVATNEGDETLYMFFYDIDYTIGDKLDDNAMYFHSCYSLENPTTIRKDYEILPKINGKGRYLGANVGVVADKKTYHSSWWGEGECKIYLDDDEDYPTLCGTGTEDYIGTGWELGSYSHLYQGCPIADLENMYFCFYRYHVPDPIYFKSSIRVTMQQIGSWRPENKAMFRGDGTIIYHAGPLTGPELTEADFSTDDKTPPYSLFERSDNWSSCAYFYLDSPENDLAELVPVYERVAALPEISKELEVMKSTPIQIITLKKYIADIDKLEKKDYVTIKEACESLLKYYSIQEEVEKTIEETELDV